MPLGEPPNLSSRCRCCGRALSDPLSMELGIGPVCRIKQKEGELMARQGSLFGHRARYTWRRDGAVLAIEDLDQGKSVTNDAEAVIRDLVELGQPVDQLVVIYRDTMGVWDRLVTKSGAFAGFAGIGERDYERARVKALEGGA